MGELTGSIEALGGKGVGGAGEDGPVGGGRGVARGVEGLAVEEEPFVVAVPGVGFYGECVCCVWGSLVVTMDLDVVSLVLMEFSHRASSSRRGSLASSC